MTVDEAIQVLQTISGNGAGWKPLQIQIIVNGITFAGDCEILEAFEYDGDRVWIYETQRNMPEWMSNEQT